MKRLFYLSAMILAFVSCDPGEWLYGHDANWYIKNNTDREITVEYNFGKPETKCIFPGDSIKICSREPAYALGVPKSNFLWDDLSDRVCYVSLYSETGTLLRRWDKQGSDSGTHHLFSETSWKSYIRQSGEKLYATFVFDVTDEDMD